MLSRHGYSQGMAAILKKFLKISAAMVALVVLVYGAATLVLGFRGYAARPLPQACLDAGGAGEAGADAGKVSAQMPVPDLAEDTALPCPLISIAVLSNGAHTDFLLPALVPFPLEKQESDPAQEPFLSGWPVVFPVPPQLVNYGASLYVYIGWGERDFYLHTPTWRDVRLSLLLRAAMGDEAALHVEYAPAPDLAGLEPDYAILRLTPAEYAELARFILDHTQRGPDGRALRIAAPGYGPYDAFYEAGGRFSMFNTCNTWVAHALAAAGQPAPRWTNLAWFVLHHLQKQAR